MGGIAVTKMHGARNDFLVLDRRDAPSIDPIAFARTWCDRRAGVGADGVLLIERSERAMARMRVINADGSEAEMCGNGIRCVARFLYEAGSGEVLDLETGAGIMRTQVVARQPDFLVRVAMGIPRIEARALPIDRASFVDMGNPHVVLVRDAQEPFDLVRVGEFFQRDAVFTNGTNVHVMIPQPSGQLNVRHFERGVGLTMACGTGAVASAAVAIAERLATSPVEVVVPGGTLSVEWDGAGTAYLTGAAVRVFDTVL